MAAAARLCAVARRDGYRQRMRIAFLILNHREPAQLLRLITTLRLELPDSSIVVHHDRFRVDISSSVLDSIENAYLLTSDKPVNWGDFSITDVCWRSMAWMCENLEFDWLILLSAQDYPIKPLATLKASLAATGADVLLRAAPIDELDRRRDRRNRRRCYLYQYRPAPENLPSGHLPAELRCWLRRRMRLFIDVLNNVQPYFHVYKISAQIPWRLGWRARHTPFTQGEPCWFGSTWITLSRRATEFVVAAVRDQPGFVDYYRRTVQADESATATLVCNAPGLHLERRDLHYVRWTHPGTGHPDTLVNEDLAELLVAPEYFARKFDIARDAKILDELDDMLARARARARAHTLTNLSGNLGLNLG